MPPKQSPKSLTYHFWLFGDLNTLISSFMPDASTKDDKQTWCKYFQRTAPPSALCSMSPRQMMEWQNVLVIEHSRYEWLQGVSTGEKFTCDF
jgi:hypothetical protein